MYLFKTLNPAKTLISMLIELKLHLKRDNESFYLNKRGQLSEVVSIK